MSNANTFNVDLETFDQKVIEASFNTPILVDFWADWCGPCIVIAPVLEQIAVELDGQIKLAKLEVDEGENMKLAGQYQVRGFPTIILFEYGKELARFSSAKPKFYIEQFIFEHATKI